MIDLQRFCANDLDSREYLRAPWWHDGWVYATNGHFAVRVKAGRAQTDAIDKPEAAPDVAAKFRKHIDETPRDFLVMPPVPKLIECFECNASAKVRCIKCPDCTEGEFKHGDYIYACQNCEHSAAGAGWQQLTEYDATQPHELLRTCEACMGLGFQIEHNGSMQIGEAHYATVYLSMLAALPQVRVSAGDPYGDQYQSRESPAAFIFDGGQALLMPRRN